MKKSFFNKNNPRGKKFKVRMFYHLQNLFWGVFVRGVFGLGFFVGEFMSGGFFVWGLLVLVPVPGLLVASSFFCFDFQLKTFNNSYFMLTCLSTYLRVFRLLMITRAH